MTYIIAVSAGVYIVSMMDRTYMFLDFLRFDSDLIMLGQVWRLVTWVFIPAEGGLWFGGILFVAIALYFYYFIGSTLEREWGTPKFTIYYISGIILNLIFGFVMRYFFKLTANLTPDYINLSMFFAFAVLYPDQVVRIFFILPIKVKWLALANAVFFVFSIVNGIFSGYFLLALLPLVALLNFFVICGEDLMGYIRPIKARASPRTISFKAAVKRAKRDHEQKSYRHKCSVCGKNDADNPGLDFRYCSRCNGYHCFCIDHINNHVHFQ